MYELSKLTRNNLCDRQLIPNSKTTDAYNHSKIQSMSSETSYWLQISSGKGPEECAYFVGKLAEIILKEARKSDIQGQIIKSISGDKANTFLSILISLEAQNNDQIAITQFLKSWEGTIKWICQSPLIVYHMIF